MMQRTSLAVLALAASTLAGCWSRESTNPYDPDAPATVPGELRVVFDLPPALPGDELADPRLRADALAELTVVAWPATGGAPIAAISQADGTRTVIAPAGSYTVEIRHARQVFEGVQEAVHLDIAERRDLRVTLRRVELDLGAEFGFGGAPVAPAGAFFDLRWLPAGVDDCVAGRSIRRFTLDGEVRLSARVFRPVSEQICALAGAPGYETVAVTPAQVELDTLDFGRIELTLAPAAVALLGLPEARDLEAGRPARGARRLGGRLALLHVTLRPPLTFDRAAPADARVERVAVVDVPIGQDTAVLERFVPLDQLPFEGSGADAIPFVGALAPSRCADFDDASADLNELLLQSDALGRELDARAYGGPETTEWLVPYCLFGDDADTRQITVALATAAGAIHRATAQFQVDRQPPSGVELEVSEQRPAVDGYDAVQRLVTSWRGRYQVHAASRVTLRVEESEPDPFEAQVPGLQWRVAYAVLSGQRYRGGWTFRACPDPLLVDFDALDGEEPGPAPVDAGPPDPAPADAGPPDLPDGGVMKGALDFGPPDGGGIVAPPDDLDGGPDGGPDGGAPLDLDAAAADATLDGGAPADLGPDVRLVQPPPADIQVVRAGAVGDPVALPLYLVPPEPAAEGDPDAYRVHRNRVCLYIEDAAGNRRQDAVDVEVVAGVPRARLRAGAEGRDGAARWTGTECAVSFPPQDCPGFDNPFLVNGEIVFSASVDPETVDQTIHDVSQLDGESTYGLRAFVVEVDQRPEAPRPYRQGRRLVYDFDGDGAHQLEVYGRDLIGRIIPFVVDGTEQAQIVFMHDSRPPTTLTRAFLTCPGCADLVEPCCDDPDDPETCDNPCDRCVPPNFVIADRLVAPADARIPVRFLFDFLFPAPDVDLCVGVRNITGDTGERAFRSLCTNAFDLPEPDDADLEPRGTNVEYGSDIYDPACNADLDPGSLAVLYDGFPPAIVDQDGIPAVSIVCRALQETCPGGGTSCHRLVDISRNACYGGRGVLEQIDLSLRDLENSPLDGAFIRYRLVLSRDDPTDRIERVCDEPAWGEQIGDGSDGVPPRRRTALCNRGPDCGCVAPGAPISLRPPPPDPITGAPSGIAGLPVAFLGEDDVLTPVTLAPFGTADAVVRDVHLYLAAEDAVGNLDLIPLSDALCSGGGCDPVYDVPVVLPPDNDEQSPTPPWFIAHRCESHEMGPPTPTGRELDAQRSYLCP